MYKNFTHFKMAAKAITIAFAAILIFAGNLNAQFTTFATTDSFPDAITIDAAGNLYVTNGVSNTVTKITSAGTSTRLGTTGIKPIGIVMNAAGNFYITNYGSDNVTKITPAGIDTVAWAATTVGEPIGITINVAGNLYVANSGTNRVMKITPAGVVSAFAHIGIDPNGIAIDATGNIYTANNGDNTVSKVTSAGVVTAAFASTGLDPIGIAIDAAGNIYTTNQGDNTVSKITPAGVSTTAFAHTGVDPIGIAIDAAGNIYTANNGDNTITKITPAGVTTTLTGALSSPLHIVINNTTGCIYVTNSGNHTVSSTCSPLLQLTLLNFSAVEQSGSAQLRWQTINEENTANFIVERSTNGNEYVKIGETGAAGNSNLTLNYNFTDNNPAAGANYYRLQMTDKDGSFTYSQVQVLNFGGDGTILVYPNPAHDNITIAGIEAGMQLRMISVDGRIITTKMATGNTENINVQKLATGIYILQAVKDGGVINTVKFSKN